MKKLFPFLFMLLPLLAMGQEHNLPIDSTTGKIVYSGVVEVPGATSDELYNRAKLWFAKSFNSSQDVVQLDSKETGTILGKGYSNLPLGAQNATTNQKIWHTIEIQIKEGRFRYIISDLGIQGNHPASPKTPADQFFSNKHFYKKNGELNSAGNLYTSGVSESMNSLITTLKSEMIKSLKQDW